MLICKTQHHNIFIATFSLLAAGFLIVTWPCDSGEVFCHTSIRAATHDFKKDRDALDLKSRRPRQEKLSNVEEQDDEPENDDSMTAEDSKDNVNE